MTDNWKKMFTTHHNGFLGDKQFLKWYLIQIVRTFIKILKRCRNLNIFKGIL